VLSMTASLAATAQVTSLGLFRSGFVRSGLFESALHVALNVGKKLILIADLRPHFFEVLGFRHLVRNDLGDDQRRPFTW